jgi:hypothetical protein
MRDGKLVIKTHIDDLVTTGSIVQIDGKVCTLGRRITSFPDGNSLWVYDAEPSETSFTSSSSIDKGSIENLATKDDLVVLDEKIVWIADALEKLCKANGIKT